MELKLAWLGQYQSGWFQIQGDTSKHKAMSYGRLKEEEQALCAEIEIDALIEQANRCDSEEDQAYRNKIGYEIPEDLQFKQVLAPVKTRVKMPEKAKAFRIHTVSGINFSSIDSPIDWKLPWLNLAKRLEDTAKSRRQ